ncbi:MAG: holo-[acyl-carrier-protein] synthase [Ignavibacteriae bacterium HGW-Ignavibacteriae-1]|jgi:holo-[acyl-carrier protein] synthase|nr:MAG: holo-[acyl-carrier-protein] synthase [Ignavibacteriae bacterium HGW-Ignavibacteriae-1]
MIFGIGTDIVDVERIKQAIESYGQRFLDRIYTDTEQEYSESFNDKKYVHYAARFAAKESFSKAIGTGITKGFKFREVGIKNEASGKPVMMLEGEMLERYGKYKIHVSLSHTDANAIAYILMESE